MGNAKSTENGETHHKLKLHHKQHATPYDEKLKKIFEAVTDGGETLSFSQLSVSNQYECKHDFIFSFRIRSEILLNQFSTTSVMAMTKINL